MADTTLLAVSSPDIVITGDDFAIDGGLETAILISLWSDARIENQRGWWAEEWGSGLWKFEREKRDRAILPRVATAATQALSWLVADGVFASVKCTAEFGADGALVIRVLCLSPTGEQATISASSSVVQTVTETNYLLTEDGFLLTTEGGDRIIWA